jgi:hypothetical protein
MGREADIIAQNGRMNTAREYLHDLSEYPPEEALTRVICHEIAVALVDHMDLSFAEAQKRVQPFLTLALKIRQHLSLEIIHDITASLSLFDPSPSEYERRLAEVQEWFLNELKSRFNKDLPEFLLLLGQMNRRIKEVHKPIRGLRDPVMDAYREAYVDHATKLKPITVEDYFCCGIITGEQAQEKLLAIFNAVPNSLQLLKLEQAGLQFRRQAIAHKQAMKAKREPSRRKQK